MWFPRLLWATSTLCLKAPLSVLIDLWGALLVCAYVRAWAWACAHGRVPYTIRWHV